MKLSKCHFQYALPHHLYLLKTLIDFISYSFVITFTRSQKIEPQSCKSQ